MKIFRGDSVYIQKKDASDIAHMKPTNANVMMGIIEACGGDCFYCSGGDDNFRFIKIVGNSLIEWVREQEWILDYDEVKDKTKEEIMDFGQSLAEQKNQLASRYNRMSRLEQHKTKGRELYLKCECLTSKMYQVADYVHYLEGKCVYEFPIGVEPPAAKKGSNEDNKKTVFQRVKGLFSK